MGKMQPQGRVLWARQTSKKKKKQSLGAYIYPLRDARQISSDALTFGFPFLVVFPLTSFTDQGDIDDRSEHGNTDPWTVGAFSRWAS